MKFALSIPLVLDDESDAREGDDEYYTLRVNGKPYTMRILDSGEAKVYSFDLPSVKPHWRAWAREREDVGFWATHVVPHHSLRWTNVMDDPPRYWSSLIDAPPRRRTPLGGYAIAAHAPDAAELTSGVATPSPDVRAEFNSLAEKWLADTRYLSSTHDIVLHPAYLRIISMGEKVVPLLIERLDDKPRRWLWALRAITGYEPPADSLEEAVAAWKSWAAKHLGPIYYMAGA